MSAYGSRAKSGVGNPRHKLTEQQVHEIRKFAAVPGIPHGWHTRLARAYGVSVAAISRAASRKAWQLLPEQGTGRPLDGHRNDEPDLNSPDNPTQLPTSP